MNASENAAAITCYGCREARMSKGVGRPACANRDKLCPFSQLASPELDTWITFWQYFRSDLWGGERLSIAKQARCDENDNDLLYLMERTYLAAVAERDRARARQAENDARVNRGMRVVR